MIYTLHREQWVSHPLKEVFDYFGRAENLQNLTPPWMHFRILTPAPVKMRPGAEIAYKMRVRGIPLRWLTVIEKWNPPHEFVDIQAKGPYALWHHTHRFVAQDGGTVITDTVQYGLPFGPIGRLVHRLQVSRDLEAIFAYRAQRVRALFREVDRRCSENTVCSLPRNP